LWEQFKPKICDDLRRKLEHMPHYQNQHFTEDQIYDYGLHLIEQILMKSGKTLTNFPPMPTVLGPSEEEPWADIAENYLLAEQLNYNGDELREMVINNRNGFNPEQAAAFDAAMESVNNNLGKTLFIHSAQCWRW
jgi:hypothetical protein